MIGVHGHKGTPATRARPDQRGHSDCGARTVRHRGLPQRLDEEDRGTHRVQPGRDLQLLPQQRRHFFRPRRGGLPAARQLRRRRLRADRGSVRPRADRPVGVLSVLQDAPGVLRSDVRRSLRAEPQPGLSALRVLPGNNGALRGRHSGLHRARTVLEAPEPSRGAARIVGGHARRGDDRPRPSPRAGRRPRRAGPRPARNDARRIHNRRRHDLRGL